MKTSNILLFTIPAVIWGSTWFAIKFQLGPVDPILSVSYRFALGGILLLIYCWLTNKNLRFEAKTHAFMGLQGVLLFGTNYWLVYISEAYLTSGLVAVGFSTLIFMNIFFNALLLGNPINKNVIVGATLGFLGTALIFSPELTSFSLKNNTVTGLAYCIGGVMFASLGNITSAFNQKKEIPVIQTNAYGMLYGSTVMLLIALITGKPIVFDLTTSYIVSLAYLSVFGSVIAFSTYLTLIGKIGADKAAYVIVAVPVIALVISALFEGYRVSVYTLGGILLILAGNIITLRKKAKG